MSISSIMAKKSSASTSTVTRTNPRGSVLTARMNNLIHKQLTFLVIPEKPHRKGTVRHLEIAHPELRHATRHPFGSLDVVHERQTPRQAIGLEIPDDLLEGILVSYHRQGQRVLTLHIDDHFHGIALRVHRVSRPPCDHGRDFGVHHHTHPRARLDDEPLADR